MKYAVFASGGKQYKVSEGTVVELEKLQAAEESTVVFDDVLLLVEDETVKVGQPNLKDVSITAKVLGQIKERKIRVAKFKAKARYRKVYGHRQHLTRVLIEKIGSKAVKVAKEAPVEVKEKKEKTAEKK